jgi:HSP20 family molecular chaperone IbpA
MSEFELKFDPLRPAWYTSDEMQSRYAGANRVRNGMRSHVWRPPTDVFETDEIYVVRVEIAGMDEAEISIELHEQWLVIRGIRQDVPERRAYHQMEISFGEFLSEIELPGPIIAEKVVAEYKGGFLKVFLPKDRPTRILIND